ncbi:PREDICTED: glycerol-3-phosphate acyltransferase 5-like [Nelumbo nucifera]|uniref:Glycerol-3-phosphate acyltransferase 5-like n=2 Tax=Nelumbo nucifera TaxID=4432 RepID=A0A1U8AB64_NELNU|nr:PREDICTED: glycerol-3-phosphate acyltransferase 5-like [Nelumbo nucifera]DAD28246.1 TPA_asm: hypothetical protein HUJ06_029714 [Nelumbo nucifera]
MEGSRSTTPMERSVVSELEGTLLKDADPFSYFMLVAFEASGLIRFTLLLMVWPAIFLLDMLGMGDAALKLTIFVAVAGVPASEIESVSRAVLPKFYMDDLDMEAWKLFSSYENRIVVTKGPRVMAERFVKEHLRGNEVVGSELEVNRFGFATGFVRNDIPSITNRVKVLFNDEQPIVALGRFTYAPPLLSFCKENHLPPFVVTNQCQDERPVPVVFHDGRLIKRPTPSMALLILLWLPFGIVLAFIRIAIGLVLPLWVVPYIARPLGGGLIIRGTPPLPASRSNGGVLFVCTHRTLMDPVVLSTALGRKVTAVTYSLSRLSEILSPIPTVRLTRIREVDAEKIRRELAKGDLVMCPEGTTCREPFLLRFSSLFAELTDQIVPVAMNHRVGLFHATTARGWKGFDPIFFFMNPRPIYEVQFLNQLPVELTCSAGRSSYDVANYVQRILANKLGFECTNLTRKDKYTLLAGNDGTVSNTTLVERVKKVVSRFNPFLHH